MASTVWKGYISFGLVLVPIRLFAAAREEHVSFHQIHKTCGSRIRLQTYCPVDNRVVERSELVKGYPVEKDRFVLITAEDLKSLEAESSEAMSILQFVKLAEVDPLYFETSYYSVPEEPGKKAYALLVKAMSKLGVAAVARITMHQREQMVLLRTYDQGIVLHTLYYPAEVREIAEYGKDSDGDVKAAEVELAEQFIRQLMARWNPGQFKDEYQERVLKMIASREAGEQDEGMEPPKRKLAPVIDLMSALKKSLESQGGAARPRTVEPGTAELGKQPEHAAGRKKAPQRAAAGRKRKTA